MAEAAVKLVKSLSDKAIGAGASSAILILKTSVVTSGCNLFKVAASNKKCTKHLSFHKRVQIMQKLCMNM